jgi:hypothetical protein
MADSPRPLRVFLCYAHDDEVAVQALYNRLKSDGVDAWLDKEKLLPGQRWQVEIPKAVRNSDVVIVCLSCQSVSKAGYVQKEIKFALDIADEKPEDTIFVVPARLEDCLVPERLSTYQWVNLFEPDGYHRLLQALKVRANQIGMVFSTESELKQLESKAIRYELRGDYWNALQMYYQIKKEDPQFPRVDIKIRELEFELAKERKTPDRVESIPRSRRKVSVPIQAAIIGAIATIIAGLLGFDPLVKYLEHSDIPTTIATSTTSSAIIITPEPSLTATPKTTPIPFSTYTPFPLQILCSARVTRDTFLYPVPSIGYKSQENVMSGSSITVIAGVYGKDWYEVRLDGIQGWLRGYLFEFSEPNCRPATYPLSYLLGIDYSSVTVLLDESFGLNQYTWIENNGLSLQPTYEGASAKLIVQSYHNLQKITSNDFLKSVSSFNLVTSIEIRQFELGSFFGVRFSDNGSNYYEVQFYPSMCSVDIISEKQKLEEFVMNRDICSDGFYYLEMSIVSGNQVNLSVNGNDVISLVLEGNNNFSDGKISFVVNNANIAFDYILIMTPK